MSRTIVSIVAAAILLHTVSAQPKTICVDCDNNDPVADGPRVILPRKNTQTIVSSDQHNDNNDQLQWSPPKKPKPPSTSDENDIDNNDAEQWSPPTKPKPKYGYSQDGLNDEENENNDEEQWSPPKKPKPPTTFEDNNEVTTEETNNNENNDELQKIRLRLSTNDNENELQKIKLRLSTNDNENNGEEIPIMKLKPKQKAKITFNASEMVELDVTSTTRVFEQLKEQIMESNNE